MLLPERWKWGEYVRLANSLWTGVRSSLVGFVAIGEEFTPQFLGTGFVIGTDPDEGVLLALTAKHVVLDGAVQVQRRGIRRAPSAPSILFDPDQPRIGPADLRAVWMGRDRADMLLVRHVTYAHNLDVALCLLEPQEPLKKKIHAMIPTVALDTDLPLAGAWVNIVTLTDFEFDRSSEGSDMWIVKTRPVIRVGKVLSIESQSMGHQGSCFITSIPTDSGMSGGFSYIPGEDHPIAACGIVSSSPEEDHGKRNFLVSGHSTVVSVLGALGLQVPTTNVPTYQLLFDLVKSGTIPDVSGGGY